MSHYGNNVPKGWTITTLGEAFTLQAGKNIAASEIHEASEIYHYPCFGGNGIRGYVDTYNRNGHYPIIGRQGALCGNVNEAQGQFYATEHAVVVETYARVDVNWVIVLLKALNLNQYATATAQPGLSVATINDVEFCLPPLEEQSRIAAKLDKCLSTIDALESEAMSLELSISKTKSKILELAISGKLVPQDPTDEPAIGLLRRINPAFKPCDNPHYENDLPKGWCSARLGDVAEYGDTSNVDVDSIAADDWVLELEDIEKDTAAIIDKKSKAEREISGVRHSFKKGQILYSKLRTYLNKVLIAPEDGFCTTEIIPITAGKALLPEYLLIVLRSPYFLEYTASCGYGVKMPRLGTNDAKNAVIPVPPIAEQARISRKVIELMLVISLL